MASKILKGIFVFLSLGVFGFQGFSQEDKKQQTTPDSSLIEEVKTTSADNIPIVSLDENEGEDGSAQNISSQLTAGRDPFINAANFRFSTVRFRIRGYDANNFSTYMNGAPMENLDNGFTPFGLWGGLNDVMRNRDNSIGLRSLPYSYGDIGGFTYLDTRASYQRKQTNINYAISNRNYTNRLMITHSTGLNNKGWAFSFSGSRRWADEGFTDGTFYDGWSFFGAADKRINARHLLSLVAIGTPTKQGRQGSSVQEMRDIAGSNFYNPFWGYQNGQKRNSSVASSFQPIIILTHDWKVNDKISVLSAASVNFGKRGLTGLDWYNVADPRPDYYRYLPSYQEDPMLAEQVRQNMQNDVNLRQINWDRLYTTNYCSYDVVHDANGIKGFDYAGKRSHYIVENRMVNTTKFNFASTINASISKRVDFSGGIIYESQKNNYYKTVDDLLGGDFYVDINQFAERDFPTDQGAVQNNLNAPNRILHEGDKFGYNYDIHISKASLWGQAVAKFSNVDLFLATEQSYTSFYRFGNVRSGLFPNNSYGKSATQSFYNYAVKGGVTYKIDGRNYVYANGSYATKAPFFDNAYIAPRTRDFLQDNLTSEKITALEGGYSMNAPKVKIRANLFYTQFKNQLNVLTFYNDQYQNFVNYALSNIGKTHMGIELAGEAKVYQGFSVNAAASIGRYRYDTRQLATVTIDNSSQTLLKDGVVYSKNFNVPTPQECYTIGVDYRSPRYWFANMNLNYFNRTFLDFNPIRRTEDALSGVDPASPLWNQIIDQTRVPSRFSLDVFAGWSWRMNNRFPALKKQTFLVFNLGINNILNNTNIVSGGFEQLRFDFAEKNVDKFPDKRFYAYGTTFFASMGLRF
jgi:hypothetical protein